MLPASLPEASSELLLSWAPCPPSPQTPLMCAAAKGHCNCVNLLARTGRNLEARSTGGSTALLLAANAGEANAVRTLLSLGANPGAANNSG